MFAGSRVSHPRFLTALGAGKSVADYTNDPRATTGRLRVLSRHCCQQGVGDRRRPIGKVRKLPGVCVLRWEFSSHVLYRSIKRECLCAKLKHLGMENEEKRVFLAVKCVSTLPAVWSWAVVGSMSVICKVTSDRLVRPIAIVMDFAILRGR